MTEPRRIALGEAPEAGVEVELWEHAYTTRPITRSVQATADEAQSKIDEAAGTDAAVSYLADLIGLLLVPSGQAPAAADLIRERWASDDLSVSQLTQLAADIQEVGEGPS